MCPHTTEASRVRGPMSRTNLRTISIITAAMASLLGASVARSECIWTSLETQIGQASIIFAGTARSASLTHAWGIESTRFRFEDIRYAKGSGPPDSVILV